MFASRPAVTAAAALTLLGLGAAPAQASGTGGAAVTCTVSTEQDRPVTFSPPVTMTPRDITARATLAVTGCTSPEGSQRRLHSGWLTLVGTGRASCTGARNVRGTATLSWFDAQGRRLGTSKLRTRTARISFTDPATGLMAGKVVEGTMKGRRAHAGLTPSGGLLRCGTSGIDELHGTGRLTIG